MCLSLPKLKTSRLSNFRVKICLKVTLKQSRELHSLLCSRYLDAYVG